MWKINKTYQHPSNRVLESENKKNGEDNIWTHNGWDFPRFEENYRILIHTQWIPNRLNKNEFIPGQVVVFDNRNNFVQLGTFKNNAKLND